MWRGRNIGKARAWLCAVLVVSLVASGCARQEVDISFDDPVAAKIDSLHKDGVPALLRSLTRFDWDQVHAFSQYTPKERIQEIAGAPIIGDSYYYSSAALLVFENKDVVVKAIAITGDYLKIEKSSWSDDVWLVPWGSGFLRLTNVPPLSR